MKRTVATLLNEMAHTTERSALLPARVRAAINRHQEQSERLVAWVQLAVVFTFAMLYALSPKTFPAEAPFAPVPWVLSIYYLFAMLHLYISYQRLPSDSFTYLSIVVDMALVYLLIWSFHLQYMQPPSFYLKAPTLLYVFIFIAMRALRFEVKFILFASATAALGWLLMVLYAVRADPTGTVITKDYVHYLTSNSVLLGGEFDKIISILLVGAVLAAAVYRARKLLLESAVETHVAEDLAHFVPEEVVASLALSEDEPQAGKAKTYNAAVMFIDIADFTAVSEHLKPEQAVATLNEYFTLNEEILEKYGGTINQFQGDAILASFNNPQGEDSPSTCAVQAALEIQQLLQQHTFARGVRLSNRIGINTGVVVGGYMGSQHRLIYTVHGDVVNVAARLEQINKELGTRLLVSRATRDACAPERFHFEPRGQVTVKGRITPTEVYSLNLA
ncbi:adenylate/guanylate cyclase domain-containing protein [Motiliproteus sp. SC1-56]|uniref:adenylate/guanylate cyclase domain-containing protein n=1 Tax=Motiliproteus sp. SC1-56 TaxID=2799565 RepID=UPI001A8EE348|nr:adenylate/guanylate cyclase domain-containing protein [Motiliproteus sp. SC1-56]